MTRRASSLLAWLLAGGWLAALAACAAFLANPVTINRSQVEKAWRAGRLIRGTVLDSAAGRVRVDQGAVTMSQDDSTPLMGEITVTGLAVAGARVGQSYLLPIAQLPKGDWEVIPAFKGPGGAPVLLIYPASDETIRQVGELWTSLGDSGGPPTAGAPAPRSAQGPSSPASAPPVSASGATSVP